MWPTTLIESAATVNHGLGEPKHWRKADILVDAICGVLEEDPSRPEHTGRMLLDEPYLRSKGVSDFTQCTFDAPLRADTRTYKTHTSSSHRSCRDKQINACRARSLQTSTTSPPWSSVREATRKDDTEARRDDDDDGRGNCYWGRFGDHGGVSKTRGRATRGIFIQNETPSASEKHKSRTLRITGRYHHRRPPHPSRQARRQHDRCRPRNSTDVWKSTRTS